MDPDSVSEGISEILKIKANKSEIYKLNKLLKSKEQEIDMRSSETIKLQKKIANQELLNNAKQEELKVIQLKLQKAQQQLKKYQRDEIALNTELGKVKYKVQEAMSRIKNQNKKACMVKKGMTMQEVNNAIGWPVSADYWRNGKVESWYDLKNSKEWYYGNITIKYYKQIVVSISGYSR